MVPRTEIRAVLIILINGPEQVSEEGHGISTRGYTEAWKSSHLPWTDERGCQQRDEEASGALGFHVSFPNHNKTRTLIILKRPILHVIIIRLKIGQKLQSVQI